jgi:hypothetical protein
MGYFARHNHSFGARKFAQSPISQIVILGVLLLGATLFFISSYKLTISLEFFFQGLGSGILMLIAIILVATAFWEYQDKTKFKVRKKHLVRKLRRQKDILKKRFDALENLSSDIEPSLNFAFDQEINTSPEALEEKNADPDRDLKHYLNESQINLAKIFIEGENISSFPAEWQQFFAENEGREPIEKLNTMLKNGENNQKQA